METALEISTYQIIVGVIMIIVFMAAILSKKMSALTALVTIPILGGLAAGFGTETFVFAMKGIMEVDTTIAMLAFAIAYFGIMLGTGLFDPLTGFVLRLMRGDPLRVLVGTAILSTLLSLDGDGTTTIMIACAALLPVYNKLGISRIWLAIFVIMPNGAINLLPWGGPTARLLAVLPVDSNELLVKLIPLILSGVVCSVVIAFFVGLQERKRLGIVDVAFEEHRRELDVDELALRRPKLVWFNLVLTIVVLLAIIAVGIPGPLVFAFGAAIALVVNYHDLKLERKAVGSTADALVHVILMILGAGILLGVLSESGLAAAMADRLISVIPTSWGPAFNFVLALVSAPAVWIMNNDAFYFGAFPVLAETASQYGFSQMQIAIASLPGQALRGFSPVIPSLYFLAAYVKIEFSDFQKKIIPFCFICFAVQLGAAALVGAF
ncbi:MAG: citrate:proton symporter [Propionibacteriaceae bacterium]|nr:citrate:proton symporter [Propionibacteriaceae bacterium]